MALSGGTNGVPPAHILRQCSRECLPHFQGCAINTSVGARWSLEGKARGGTLAESSAKKRPWPICSHLLPYSHHQKSVGEEVRESALHDRPLNICLAWFLVCALCYLATLRPHVSLKSRPESQRKAHCVGNPRPPHKI